MILRFLKNWTLPVAMLTGALGYFFFARVEAVAPWKPYLVEWIACLTPFLIFAQLLLTFCKIEPRDLKPTIWHYGLLLVQVSVTGILAFILYEMPMDESLRIILQGALICVVCPTATAAAVITGKLGGNVSALTTYTLMSNLMAAILVPSVFPWVEVKSDLHFWEAFCRILNKVFPLLLFPFFLAWMLRIFFPRVHRFLVRYQGMAFYLWAVALAIVSGQTIRFLVQSDASWTLEVGLAFVGLLACMFQFYWGKRMGRRVGDTISAGQALGQKNTVLAIWMAYTYLNPLSSVAPGSYVLWQNLFNSWQLWKMRKS